MKEEPVMATVAICVTWFGMVMAAIGVLMLYTEACR